MPESHKPADGDADTDSQDNRIDQEAADRLKQAVESAGGVSAVARRAAIAPRSLSYYLNGREMRRSTLVKLAYACGVTVEWLATGDEPKLPGEPARIVMQQQPDGPVIQLGMHRQYIPRSSEPRDRALETASTPSFITIPRYDVRAAAGRGLEVVDEELLGHLALEETFLRQNLGRRREHLVSIVVEGDSMDPTIRDGDLLVVDTSVTEIRSSRIYVLSVNDLLLVKRIQMQVDGTLSIKSDNPKYAAELFRPSERDSLRIIGQVIYQAGPVRS